MACQDLTRVMEGLIPAVSNGGNEENDKKKKKN